MKNILFSIILVPVFCFGQSRISPDTLNTVIIKAKTGNYVTYKNYIKLVDNKILDTILDNVLTNWDTIIKIPTKAYLRSYISSHSSLVDTTKTPLLGHYATQWDVATHTTIIDTTKTDVIGHYGTQHDLALIRATAALKLAKTDTSNRLKVITRKAGDSLYWKKSDTTSTLESQAKATNQLSGKVSTGQAINGTPYGSGNITIYQYQITEPLVTPGGRTILGLEYRDSFWISTDTIKAGAAYHPLIRTYGLDTSVIIDQIIINVSYKTAPYTCTGTDTIKIRTKLNSKFINACFIFDDQLKTTYSHVGFIPFAIDMKDQGASWSLYIPNDYTVGAGNIWLDIKYHLEKRKIV